VQTFGEFARGCSIGNGESQKTVGLYRTRGRFVLSGAAAFFVFGCGLGMKDMDAIVQKSSRLLPAKQAAAEIGLPYTSLRERVFKGELPVVKLGRAWYFKRTDLDAFIERHTEQMAIA
jgi:excisionase family DNA binding protein